MLTESIDLIDRQNPCLLKSFQIIDVEFSNQKSADN